MAGVCCNACRTCVTSNILGLVATVAVGVGAALRRVIKTA